MRRPGGYLIITGPGAPTVERDTFTCCHCSKVVVVLPGQPVAEVGGFCLRCSKPMCPACVKRDRCDPFEAQIEREEARDRLRRAVLG